MLYCFGNMFQNRVWFRNSELGHKWACAYHKEVDGTDEYLLWQLFIIK